MAIAACGVLLAGAVVMPSAQATTHAAKTRVSDTVTQVSAKKVQQKLNDLGYPHLQTVDGKIGNFSKNALCAWRETMGGRLAANRGDLTRTERNQILAQKRLPEPKYYMVTGLNVDKRCQALYWVGERANGKRYYRGIFPVSTGNPGYPLTPGGYSPKPSHPSSNYSTMDYKGTITWSRDYMHIAMEGGAYPAGCSDGQGNVSSAQRVACGNMYRPMYFGHGGDAFHGRSYAYAKYLDWYPNSHGCVRMLHADIDKLWKANMDSTSTQVNIYGTWTTK